MLDMRRGTRLVSGLAACLLLIASTAIAQIDNSYQKFFFGVHFANRLFIDAQCRWHLTYENMQAHGYEIPADSFVALGLQDSTWADCRPPFDRMLGVICGVPVRLRSVAMGEYWSSNGLFAPEPLQCLLAPLDSMPSCDASYFLIFRDGAPFDRKIRRYESYNPPVPRRLTTLQSLALSYARKADSLAESNHDLKLDIFSPSDSPETGPLYVFAYRTVRTEFAWSDLQVIMLELWQSNVKWEVSELRDWTRVDGPMSLECTLDVDGDQEPELMAREAVGAAVFNMKLGRLEAMGRATWVAP